MPSPTPLWQSQPEKALEFDVNVDSPDEISIHDMTFGSDILHPRNMNVLVLVDDVRFFVDAIMIRDS